LGWISARQLLNKSYAYVVTVQEVKYQWLDPTGSQQAVLGGVTEFCWWIEWVYLKSHEN